MAGTWLLCFLLLGISGLNATEKLKKIYTWKSLEFDFPTPEVRQEAIRTGEFNPGGPLPIDVDVYNGEKQKIFISVPRFQDGVPLTLGYVTDKISSEGNPIIAPYPSWRFNKLGNCDGITSVYRMKVDECGRLWVLDTGLLKETRVCNPKLHIFDLKTDRLIRQYKFPTNHLKPESLLVTIAVDIRHGECDKPFAYIADVTGFQLIVYDYEYNRSWRITNNLFYPYPSAGTFDIKGAMFDLMDGILGLALSPLTTDQDRILYFHSLASKIESRVSTSIIRNYTIFHEQPDAAARAFIPFSMERSSQAAAQAMDQNGVLFFGLMSDLALGCWNSVHFPEFGGKNNEIIVHDPETLQFISGLKVITRNDGKEELWLLSPSFQKFMTGSLRSDETNFRILAGPVDVLVRGTKCDVQSLNIEGSRFQNKNSQ